MNLIGRFESLIDALDNRMLAVGFDCSMRLPDVEDNEDPYAPLWMRVFSQHKCADICFSEDLSHFIITVHSLFGGTIESEIVRPVNTNLLRLADWILFWLSGKKATHAPIYK